MGIFDFNGDGKTSFGEELFGLGIAGMIIDDMEREEREQQDLLDEGDEDADDDPDVDDEDTECTHSLPILQASICIMRCFAPPTA